MLRDYEDQNAPKLPKPVTDAKAYVKLPVQLLFDERLTRTAIVLAAVLIDLSDDHGCATVTLQRLSYLCHCNPSTIRRAESLLVETGWITVIPTGRASMIWITQELRTGNQWSAIEWTTSEILKEGL